MVTGPSAITERLNLHNQASLLHVSGLSQLAVLSLFRHWGVGNGEGDGNRCGDGGGGGGGGGCGCGGVVLICGAYSA
jgi:hypothetical protein